MNYGTRQFKYEGNRRENMEWEDIRETETIYINIIKLTI